MRNFGSPQAALHDFFGRTFVTSHKDSNTQDPSNRGADKHRPIKVENPERPLGTHLFTLLELQDEGASFRWNVVSMPETLSSTSTSSNKTPDAPVQGTSGTVRSDPSPDDANAALDRIGIPPDVVGRISQILTPGSSLIVSDYGLSRETGTDTDFIVVMP